MSTWTSLVCVVTMGLGCGDNLGPIIDAAPSTGTTLVYIESNDPTNNAVLAFLRSNGDVLTLVGTYPTGGVGITAGPTQRQGPLDSDQQIATSVDNAFLYAVNAGDHTVAGFSIDVDGSLTALAGSPFNAGGANPVSLGLTGDTMYVVDKVIDGSATPRYGTLSMTTNIPILLAAPALAQAGGSPTIAYVSRDQHYLLGTEFLDGARLADAPVGQIDVLTRGDNGELAPAPGSPFPLPPDDTGIVPAPAQVALDVIEHPWQSVVYIAFPTRSEIGVYTIDDAGLTFVRTVPSSSAIGWFTIDRDGHFMYAVNSESATVSTFDLADPMTPTETTAVTLSSTALGPPFVDAMGATQTMTSLPFELSLDPDGTLLYVISQRVTTNPTDLAGNLLHVLDVGADGTLIESEAPIDLTAAGVAATARPQGVRAIVL
jgi:hypothetical protein